jgi:hypothetical protein
MFIKKTTDVDKGGGLRQGTLINTDDLSVYTPLIPSYNSRAVSFHKREEFVNIVRYTVEFRNRS